MELLYVFLDMNFFGGECGWGRKGDKRAPRRFVLFVLLRLYALVCACVLPCYFRKATAHFSVQQTNNSWVTFSLSPLLSRCTFILSRYTRSRLYILIRFSSEKPNIIYLYWAYACYYPSPLTLTSDFRFHSRVIMARDPQIPSEPFSSTQTAIDNLDWSAWASLCSLAPVQDASPAHFLSLSLALLKISAKILGYFTFSNVFLATWPI